MFVSTVTDQSRKFVFGCVETYRYGFNGKENDNEVKGNGNQQDYGMRIYDSRLGRFLSVDPLAKDFAWNSPYAFAENDVIRSIDIDGLEKKFNFYKTEEDGSSTLVKSVSWNEVRPGEEHGPRGSGQLNFYYDNKAKKFSEGQYSASFEEAHPIRNFLLKAESRYQDKKGFRTFGKDLSKKAAPVVKGLGIVTAVFVPAAGFAIYKAGGYMEDVGDAVEIIADIDEGKTNDVIIDMAAMVAKKAAGKAAGKAEVKDEVRKFASEAAVDKAADENVDALKEGAKQMNQ